MRRYGRSGWYGERHRHYLAAKGISTKRYFMPTDETEFERNRRLRAGFNNIVKIDANKFKSAFEEQEGDDLDWNPDRLENLRTLDKDWDSYPRVIVRKGHVGVEDGRHRISLAAERGEKVDVAVYDDSDMDELKKYFLTKDDEEDNRKLDELLIETTKINMRINDIQNQSNKTLDADLINELTELGTRRMQIMREEQEIRDRMNMLKRQKNI